MKVSALHINKNTRLAIYKQIYESLRSDILEGFIHQGDQLPSLRVVAKQLQISRTSVERAYTQLEFEGYIRASAKRGYFVCASPDDIQLRKQILAPPIFLKKFSKYDLDSRSVDANGFDFMVWKRYIRDIMERKDVISAYGAVEGEWELRLALQQYAFSKRGVIGDIHQFMIGASFQTLLSLVCGLFEEATVIGMEWGSFPQAQQIFNDFRLPIHFIDCDDEEVMKRQLLEKGITVFYCHTPLFGSRKFPISSDARTALISWAEDEHHYLLEDDHNGEFSSGDHVRSAMQGYDRHQHTFYFGSFSKLLLPSLRIAYVVLPPFFAKRFQDRAHAYNATASKVEQLALAYYISDGHLSKHVRRLRRHYLMKQQAMEQCMNTHFADMKYEVNFAGLCYRLYMKEAVIDFVIDACADEDMLVQRDDTSLVLSYAKIAVEDMEVALEKLRRQIDYVVHTIP